MLNSGDIFQRQTLPHDDPNRPDLDGTSRRAMIIDPASGVSQPPPPRIDPTAQADEGAVYVGTLWVGL